MQKRILSLLLVLCMLLPMIPVGVMSVVAAEADTLPSSSINQSNISIGANNALSLPDGWSVVEYDRDAYTMTAGTSDLVYQANQWGYGQMYSNAGGQPVLYMESGRDNGIYAGLMSHAGDPRKTPAYSYEAPETGFVTISIDALRCYQVGNTPARAIAIFVDGVMVWPTANAGKAYLSPWAYGSPYNTWYNFTGSSTKENPVIAIDESVGNTVENLYVEKGQRIEFFAAAADGYTNMHEGYVQADLTVAYSKVIKATSSFNRNDATIDLDTFKVSLNDGWSMVARNAGSYASSHVIDTSYIDVNFYGYGRVQLPGTSLIVRASEADQWAGQSYYDHVNNVWKTWDAAQGAWLTSETEPTTGIAPTDAWGGGGYLIAEELGFNNSPKVMWFAHSQYEMLNAYFGEGRFNANHWGRPDYWGAWLGLGPTSTWNAGYSYTAPQTGVIDVEIDDIDYYNLAGNNGWGDADKYVAIFVDGVMVWPTKGGSYTDTADWKPAAELSTGLVVEDVVVFAGDKVEFLAKSNATADAIYAGLTVYYTAVEDENTCFVTVENASGLEYYKVAKGGAITPTYDGAGNFIGWAKNNSGEVNYANGASITVTESMTLSPMTADPSVLNRENVITPNLNQDGFVGSFTLPANWSFVGHGAADWSKELAIDAFWKDYIFVSKDDQGNAIGDVFWYGGNYYPSIGFYNWGASDGRSLDVSLNAGTGFFASYSYKAPYNGHVNVDIDNIRIKDAENVGQLIGLFVDGVMVWPNTGDYYNDASKWYAVTADDYQQSISSDLLDGITVEAGQKVELIARTGWQGSSVGADMTVTYTDVVSGEAYLVTLVGVGEKGMTTVFVEKNSSYTLPAVENIAFIGWDANGDGKAEYPAGKAITVNASMTLTPVMAGSSLTPDKVGVGGSGQKITLPEGWSFVGHNATNYADKITLDTYADDVNANGIFNAETPNLGATDGKAYPMIIWNAPARGSNMGIMARHVYAGGYAYTAPVSGFITINLENVATLGDVQGEGANGGDMRNTLVALFVDGKMVWPSAGGSYSDASTWYDLGGNEGANKTALIENGLELSNVYVQAGQAVEFLVLNSWWANPVKADMTVSYGKVVHLPGAYVFDRDDAYYDQATNTVVLPDNWSLVARDANAYATWKPMSKVYAYNDTIYFHETTDGSGWIMNAEIGWPWGDSPRIPWLNKRDAYEGHGAWLGLGTRGEWTVGYSFTAPETGAVTLSINEIIDLAEHDTSDWANPDKYIAIFVNGTMVWPNAGDYYTDITKWQLTSDNMSAAELDQSLLQTPINVTKGDKIELLSKVDSTRTSVGDAVYVGWSVQYTDITYSGTAADNKVETDADVALGEKFAVAFTPAEVDGAANESGVYINGVKYVNGFTLEGIAAAELGDEITYAPYQVINGIEYVEEEKTTTGIAILGLYTGDEADLANATINYAKAAGAHFDENETEVPEDIKTVVDAYETPDKSLGITTDLAAEDVLAGFTGVNVYLQDTIDMAVFFQVAESVDINNVTVEVVVGGETITIDTFKTSGNEYVAMIEDIPMAAYGEDMQMTVYNSGARVSETLSYGVSTYAVRMINANPDDAQLVALLKTILMLGEQAAAYNA